MARYLLDTNHLGAALDARSPLRERIFQSRRAGHRFGTCVPVLCELEAGLLYTRRRDQNRRILAVLLREVRIWPLERSIAPLYAEIFSELRDRGRVLSQVDILLAALSRSMDATLLTSDRDFEALPDLRVENWLR
jgi:tRNA(fMet)-specific endonuclease VapC